MDQAALLACVLLSVLALRVRPAWALFALASLAPPLCSGTTISGMRFVAVVFPAFVMAAWLLRRAATVTALCAGMAILQGVLFATYVAYRWVA